MKRYTFLLVTVIAFLVFSCRSAKTISGGNANFKLSTKQLIKANAKQTASFKTLQSKVKIDYSDGNKSQSHSVNIRVEKDKVIWLNAGLLGVSLARVIMTPTNVRYYSKLSNEYFDGDFSLISDLLGTELDFQKVQNLLIGETLFDLKNDSYKSSVDNHSYLVQPKKNRELFDIFFLIDPSHFKVKSQQISQIDELRHLEIGYVTYQEVDGQLLPERIKVNAVEANEELVLSLEFKGVTLNDNLRFPFKIPSGFDEIKL